MMKNRELELNFPRVSFFMLRWQALTVTAVIPVVWLDFSKISLVIQNESRFNRSRFPNTPNESSDESSSLKSFPSKQVSFSERFKNEPAFLNESRLRGISSTHYIETIFVESY